MKPVEQLSQILRAASHILVRIEHVPYIEPHGGLRHQLHEPDGPRGKRRGDRSWTPP